LAHFKDLVGTRIFVGGPRALLTAAAAQGIGMALHELTTNAAKYGALSNTDGQVRIEWQTTVAAKPIFSMSWREEGGPKVMAPARSGFGRIVVGRMAAASVDGDVDIAFEERGLAWKLSAPAENALAPSSGEGPGDQNDDAR
jgi:two-component sensor histidine kinase